MSGRPLTQKVPDGRAQFELITEAADQVCISLSCVMFHVFSTDFICPAQAYQLYVL
jgi:hypothetical protein